MASKKDSAKTEEQQTSLATTTGTSSALATGQNAELAAALDGLDVGDGGLGEVSNEDIKIPVLVFNMKGTTPDGEPIPPNVFFDSIDETTAKSLELVFLDLHKSNEYRVYDEAEGRSKTICRSNDQVMGVMSTPDGDIDRPCKGCPDAQWGKNEKGKRTRNCGPVYSMIAAKPDGTPAVMRFKRTSLPVIQQHLNRHHIGKLAGPGGKRGNVPLFAVTVRASLKMSEDKKYAIPVLERGRVLSREEVMAHAESSRFYRQVILPMLEKLADKESDASATGGDADDTSFDFGGEAPKGRDRFADNGAGAGDGLR